MADDIVNDEDSRKSDRQEENPPPKPDPKKSFDLVDIFESEQIPPITKGKKRV